MKKVYRLISMALLFVMVASAMLFAQSCDCHGGNGEGTTAPSANSSEAPSTGEPIPTLAEVDYGGYEFNVLWPTTQYDGHFMHNEIAVEQDNADLIESAVFKRNQVVEQQYKVNILSVLQKFTTIIDTMDKLDSSGSFEYDAFCSQLVNVTPLAIKGALTDFNDMEYYDEEYPWWDHEIMQGFSIVNHKFFGAGDIIVSDNYYPFCVMASLDLIENYGLEDPYELVRNGTWTVDKMMEMTTGVATSLDGSDTWTYQDQYGLVVTQSISKGLFYGFGKNMVTTDSNGNIEWVMTPEYTQDSLEKIVDVFSSVDTFNTQPAENRAPDLSHSQTAEKMFTEGRVLFEISTLIATERQRGDKIPFALMPMPKYTAEQENYISLLNDATLLCVPRVSDDLDRTSLLLSAMGRASMDTLTPAFFEQTLTARNISDPDSVEMVSLILDTVKVPDIATTFDYGDFLTEFYKLVQTGSTEFSSVYGKHIETALGEIQNLLTKFS